MTALEWIEFGNQIIKDLEWNQLNLLLTKAVFTSMEWNEGRMEWKIILKFYGERRKYELIVTKYEWVEFFCDEDCKEIWCWDGMSIPSKTCGIEF